MAHTDRKLRELDRLLRLRRVYRQLPDDPDVTSLRLDAEHALGPTVSRRLAARVLGVSHTALARWIERGDIPCVFTPEGRHDVPVQALLDLREQVEAAREGSTPRAHDLEAALLGNRRRAAKLRVEALISERADDTQPHRSADLRGLAYHRALAMRLDGAMAREARYRLRAWSDAQRIDPRYSAEWEALLDGPIARLREAITEDSEPSRRLRQSSPFAGALSEAERLRVLELVS